MLAVILTGALAYGVHRIQVTRCGEALLRFAGLARERNDIREAVEFLERYISLIPESNTGPLADLGFLQAELGRHGQAAANFESVLLQHPHRDDVRKRLVDVTVAMRRYPEALQHLSILLKSSPDDVELLGLSGRCQFAMGEFTLAIDAFTQAIKLDPARLEFYFRLATLHDQLNDTAMAQSVLDEMVAENAGDHRAYVLRGGFRLAQANTILAKAASDEQTNKIQSIGDLPQLQPKDDSLDAAVQDARDALTIAPDDEAVIVFAVRCFLSVDKPEEAEELARRGLKLYPKNAYIYSSLSNVELKAGHRDEAISWLQKGVAAVPDEPNLLCNLLDMLIDAGRISDVKVVLEGVQRVEHSGPLWHYGEAVRLSFIAKQEQQPELNAEAKNHLTEARLARPGWSRVPLLLAQINDAEGDEDAAISSYIEAINLGERDPRMIRRTVAWLYKRKRFKETAQIICLLQEQQIPFSMEMTRLATDVFLQINDIERALAMVRKVESTSKISQEQIWAGQIYSTLGRDTDAERSLRKAIELDETAADAWAALIRHLGLTGQVAETDAALREAQQKIKSGEASLKLAQALDSFGRFDDAKIQFQSVLEADPNNIALIKRVVEFYLRHSNVRKAEPLLVQTLGKTDEISDDDRLWFRRNLALIWGVAANPDGVKKALQLLDENLALQPASIADRRAKAMMLARTSERTAWIEAVEILEKLLVEDNSQTSEVTAESLFALVQLYLALGDISKATTHARSLMVISGENPRYLAFYVRFLLDRNELVDAELWLPRLVAVTPHESTTLRLSVELQFRQHRYDDLLSSIDKFLANAENNVGRQLLMRNATALLEGYGKMLKSSENAVHSSETPVDWGSRFLERAEVLYRKSAGGRSVEALALAAFLGRQGRYDESLDILEREWSNARWEDIATFSESLFASTAATPEQFSRAEGVFRAALDEYDRPIVLVLSLAQLQNGRGLFDDAELLYREVLQRQDRNVSALNNLAVLLAVRGRGGQEPITLIEKAIEVVGPDPHLLDSRATINLALGDLKSAAADLERVLASQPNALSFMHRSQLELRLGQRAAARESLTKARELGLRMQTIHPLERPGYRQLQKDLR